MKQYLLKILKNTFTIVAVISVIVFWSVASYYAIDQSIKFFAFDDGINTATTTIQTPTAENMEDIEEDCNVYGINLHGDIVTSHGRDAYNDMDKLIVNEVAADDVMYLIQDAEKNEKIEYIIVEIDSSGGSPAAGMEMMTAFKNSKKPVVAFARDRALSAAYLAATGAQTIFASNVTDIGSIGVSASYLENVNRNKKEGLKYIDLSVGKYKDTMNPDRPLSNDEKKLIMRDVNLIHEYFMRTVSVNRKLDMKKVRKLADGSTMLGEAALKNGLIDKIGNYYDVRKFVEEKIGKEIKVCWKN